MRIKYAKKVSFFIMWLLYVTTAGAEQIRACVSRYDQSAWNVNWWRSLKWCTYCKHRMWGCIIVLNRSEIFAIPIQYFNCVIQSDPNPVVLYKYLIQSSWYPKEPVIKHLTAVINADWIFISDPVEFFRNPVQSGSGSELQNPVGSRPQHVQHHCINAHMVSTSKNETGN